MVFDLIFRRQLSLLELRGEAGAAHHRAAVGRQRRDLEEAMRSRHQNQGRKLSPSTLGFGRVHCRIWRVFEKLGRCPKTHYSMKMETELFKSQSYAKNGTNCETKGSPLVNHRVINFTN